MPAETSAPVSILGIDPGQQPAAAPPPEPAAPEPPKGVTLTDQQYQALLDKARNYETIMHDPQASAMVHDYYKTKIATAASGLPPVSGTPPPQPTVPATPDGQVDVLALLRQQNEQIQQGMQIIGNLQTALGNIQLDNFKLKNPDYSGPIEAEAVRILKANPSIGLPYAYELAKSRAGQVQPSNGQSAPVNPAARAAEGRGAGELPDFGDAFAQAERRIADRKALPSTESYIAEAQRVARQLHGE